MKSCKLRSPLIAASKAINLRGNEFANVIVGNAGTNVIGAGGNDTPWGLGGADFFLFETAPNSTSHADTIGDFNPTDHTIVFGAPMFPGLRISERLTRPRFSLARRA